ncbi:MAG TPA: hypothetical protein VK843_10770 [Planctomycetota bacterium]|nr:hypothetical protein [Planctomycetota bacterium]
MPDFLRDDARGIATNTSEFELRAVVEEALDGFADLAQVQRLELLSHSSADASRGLASSDALRIARPWQLVEGGRALPQAVRAAAF